MLEVMLLFHFNRSIDTESCGIAALEDNVHYYLKKNLDAADLIDIYVLGPDPLQRWPTFAQGSQDNVFIGLILTAEQLFIERLIVQGDGIKDYILEGLSGESIYFLKYWNVNNHKYYAVKLLKFSDDGRPNQINGLTF